MARHKLVILGGKEERRSDQWQILELWRTALKSSLKIQSCFVWVWCLGLNNLCLALPSFQLSQRSLFSALLGSLSFSSPSVNAKTENCEYWFTYSIFAKLAQAMAVVMSLHWKLCFQCPLQTRAISSVVWQSLLPLLPKSCCWTRHASSFSFPLTLLTPGSLFPSWKPPLCLISKWYLTLI